MNNFLSAFVVTLALLLPFSSAAQNQRSDNDRRVDQSYGDHDRWQSRLSPEDQNRFDSYYSRWQNYKRTNNRQQSASMEERMRKIMSAHSIPDNASYADVMDMLTDRDRQN